ncbi:MAG: hypothetical protein JNM68_09515 [Dinghuibacter sp.]|nr:hypothetical protein [Dinghuibacter sp.]
MKQKITIFCALLLCGFLFRVSAQNTFPASGNVGIGTTSPAQRLHVVGTALFTRDNAAECCSGGNFTLAIAENTTATGKKAKISFHNSGFDEGAIELSREAGFRSLKIYDHQNMGLGLDVRGQGVFARDGSAECCSGVYTLALAENTSATGRRAKISFHNSGFDEGAIELTNEPGYRSLKIFDHQGANLGMYVTGNVRIGNVDATRPGYKLFVETGILTEKIKVAVKTSADWADHVFNQNYPLMPLEQVEAFIQTNKHLPGMPSAQEMVTQGNDLGKTDALLLQKIEELTLHLIEMKKENRELQRTVQEQAKEIGQLKNKQ